MHPELSESSSVSYKMKIYGSKGGFEPPNTMTSFMSAVSYGLDGIDLDVWITKDLKLVVVQAGEMGEVVITDSTS
jgi:glycerophosphoryl diester phosphodiesterase